MTVVAQEAPAVLRRVRLRQQQLEFGTVRTAALTADLAQPVAARA
jgi:hypothetical protein